MSLKSFNSSIECWDTNSLKKWGQKFSDTLLECQLVRCEDTGQITWSAAEYTLNTLVGYEIWRFDDILQATAPIYIRIDYGVGAVNSIQAFVNVGQGTDGAGNLTGLTSIKQSVYASYEIPRLTSWMSYFTYNKNMGFLGVHYGINSAQSSAAISFMIARSCDDNGLPNDEGYALYIRHQSIFVSYKVKQAQSPTNNYAMMVPWFAGGQQSSVVDTEVQLAKHYMATPKIRQIPQCLLYLTSEIPQYTLFVSMISGISHTYVALPNSVIGGTSNWGIGTSPATHSLAMLWE